MSAGTTFKRIREEENDYWSIVLRQLRKNKMGIAGLSIICVLFIVAVFAPFLAENIPITVTHANREDRICQICVDLGESRDVLVLKDGRTLEGKLVRELKVGILFRTQQKPERYDKDDLKELDLDQHVIVIAPPAVAGRAVAAEAKKVAILVEGELARESKVEVVLRGDLGDERRVPRAEVKELKVEPRPEGRQSLLLKSSPVVLRGTYLGEDPAKIEFSVDGKTIDVPVDQKVSLETLPRQHGLIRHWPLLRGLSRTDRALLLALFTILVGIPLFRWLRFKGRTRGAAFERAFFILGPVVLIGAIWIGLRPSERQRFNLVDFRAVETRLQGGKMIWPIVPFNDTTEDKRAIPNLAPRWLESKPVKAELSDRWPQWEAAAKDHLLGTDPSQHDILAMMIHGTRISLSVGLIAVAIYVTIGVIIGSIAGFFGGWTDDVIMRIIEIVICFPTFFLIITIVAIAPPSIFWVMGSIALVQWTTVARLVRAEFLRLRKNDFVTSARALGASRTRIIFRHILPNALSPVLVSATFGIAGAILTESALSFLGIGIPPDVATWGKILRLGQKDLPETWWLALIPGIAIFVTVTAYNLFGEALRDALDPRLKGTS